jgi:hypothetical protein
MTRKPEDRVAVWHPVYNAPAKPLRADLETWLAAGWQEQPTPKAPAKEK